MDGIKITERAVSADEFIKMRKSVGWNCPEKDLVETGLKNTLFSLCAEKEGELIGYVRLVGDCGLILYIQDLIVKPGFQGTGVGTKMMREILEHIENTYPDVPVSLMAAKGKEPFYKRLGFVERPNERLGAGMLYRG